ncbi:MAG: hypothetical protein IKG23_09250 [Clostridia bacterium]|nr:hypothetical protein [Clostridia bacterium]
MVKTTRDIAKLKEKVSQDFLRMAPDALDALHDMMTDENINPLARVQAIAVILDRGLGKPEENIRIRDEQGEHEASRKRLDAIAERIRREIEGEQEEKVPLEKSSSQNNSD